MQSKTSTKYVKKWRERNPAQFNYQQVKYWARKALENGVNVADLVALILKISTEKK
jgi:hypothetical protein